MVEDKSKKQKIEESDEEQADEALIASIGKLQEVQDELEKLNGEFGDEVLKIEQEYNAIRKPVYDKRNEAIKSVPDFWLNAIMGHPALSLLLTDEDQKILKYLSSLEVDEFKDVKSGYSITLNFQPNPYFEETKLTKTFNFSDEGTAKVTVTQITWKEGKGVPNGVATEKKGSKRPHADESDSTSFFSWFSDTETGSEDLDMDGGPDEVAELIREELWRNPLAYFIDEEVDEEDSDGEEGDGEQGGDESSEDDDEEE